MKQTNINNSNNKNLTNSNPNTTTEMAKSSHSASLKQLPTVGTGAGTKVE